MKQIEEFVLSRNLATAQDLVFMKILVRKKLSPKLPHRQGRKQYLHTYPEINRALFTNPWVPLIYKLEHIAITLNPYPEWSHLEGASRRVY